MAQISTIPGNPAYTIRSAYAELMGIECIDTLKIKAFAMITSGRGISHKNAAKFRRTVSDARTVTDLRFYLTNFVLAADGDPVIGSRWTA